MLGDVGKSSPIDYKFHELWQCLSYSQLFRRKKTRYCRPKQITVAGKDILQEYSPIFYPTKRFSNLANDRKSIDFMLSGVLLYLIWGRTRGVAAGRTRSGEVAAQHGGEREVAWDSGSSLSSKHAGCRRGSTVEGSSLLTSRGGSRESAADGRRAQQRRHGRARVYDGVGNFDQGWETWACGKGLWNNAPIAGCL
jgi:hypothetical protein